VSPALDGCRTFGPLPSGRRFSHFDSTLLEGSIPHKIYLANHIGGRTALEGELPWQRCPLAMLRITIDEGKDAVVLRLEGQLIGPWVEDVEQCWRKAFETLGSRTVQVDLSAVNFMDASGGANARSGLSIGRKQPSNRAPVGPSPGRPPLGRELIRGW